MVFHDVTFSAVGLTILLDELRDYQINSPVSLTLRLHHKIDVADQNISLQSFSLDFMRRHEVYKRIRE